MDFVLEHGDKVRDQLSGFEGVISGRADYITGCNQYLVSQPVDKDGKHREGRWFDEQRLELVQRSHTTIAPLVAPARTPDPGGPGEGEEAPVK